MIFSRLHMDGRQQLGVQMVSEVFSLICTLIAHALIIWPPCILGKYAASGSSSNGMIFVWEIGSGKAKVKLQGHESCACGVAWSRGGASGQQVASVDKKGSLILWA